MRPPDPKAVYLRGKLAGQDIRITAHFHDPGGLFSLQVLFLTYRTDQPVMSTPMGAYCRKTFGVSARTAPVGNATRFKTSWGWARIHKQEGFSLCLCPRGSKCNCARKRWTEYVLTLKAINRP